MKKIKYIALISGLIIVSSGCQRNDSSHIPNGEKITEVFTDDIVEDTEESYSDNIYENITEESTYVEPTGTSDILDGTYRRIYRYEYAKNNFYYTFTPDYMGALNGTWISSINNSPDEGGIYTLNEDIVTISVTYDADDVMDDADNMEESHKAKGITQALNDFTEMYSNVEINYEAIPKEEYSERLKAAAEENNLPDLFESTGIDEAVLSNAETLGNVISEVDTDKLYFLNNYEEYYKSEKQIPTSFVMPVVFINTTKAEFDGDFLKDINEIVSDDKEITYSIDDDWIEYYNDKVDFGKYKEIEDGKEAFVSGQSSIYFGSSKDIEGIYETMTGKCKHITLEGDEVQCRAGCDWSISGISGKDEIKVAERLLAYLIEDPTAQDYLYMQGDLGDKTKLPVNKGAIETLIGDDAQFYKNILSEIDNFGYKGE